MNRFLSALLLVWVLGCSLTLSACGALPPSLQRYSDSQDGYEFLYPNGWIAVDVKQASPGVDVVFHDLIERSENLSVIVSDIPQGKSLGDLGSPSDVGYRLLQEMNRRPNSQRQAELINAEQHEAQGKTYYTLEYQVSAPNMPDRHDIATVTTNRGKLLTFNLSTSESRWPKVENLFKTVVNSFTVY